ncbi:MAG TPA: hypothetical protein DCR77_01455, partial [Flavobacteriaceae bacterium]|nr:hypothetical protein [Flavobacteriaceae bacterium]
MGLISFTTFGQTTIFNAAGNSSIEGWTYTNNVTTNQIQQSSYWLIDAGNPSDIITSSNYIGNYTDVNLKFEYATYGSGSNPVLKIEYSTDNGDTFTLLGTNNKATSSTFVNENSVVPNFSTSIMFRFSNESLSGKGVRLKNIVLTGNQPINTPPTVSSKTITGTYGVLLSDGTVTATGNPTSWTQTGTLPLGITFDNGVFSGTPTQAGTFTTQVTATNQYGTSDPANVTFEIAKANQTVSHTFANLSQNQGTTFSDLPTQTDQGLNIVYTSADNSVVSTNGNILSFDGIGSTTITATAVSNNNYNEFSTTFDVSVTDPNATYCFEETFDGLNGNNTGTTGSNTAWDGNSNFPTTSSAYQAGEAVKLGTSSKTGAITSKTLDEISGNVTVSFDVKGWTSVEGSINVTLGSETKNVTYTAKIADPFET